MDNYEGVVTDCERAIQLDPESVKAHYLLGKGLTCLKIRMNEAVSQLRRAYDLAIDQKVTYIEDILNALKEAKKTKWSNQGTFTVLQLNTPDI